MKRMVISPRYVVEVMDEQRNKSVLQINLRHNKREVCDHDYSGLLATTIGLAVQK